MNSFDYSCPTKVVFGIDKIKLVNRMDSEALDFFNKKQYLEASEVWEDLIEIKTDVAYYLNLIQTLIIIGENEKVEYYINEVENKNLYTGTGKFDYLKALYYQKNENIKKACESFKVSFEKGYDVSKSFLDYNNCFN